MTDDTALPSGSFDKEDGSNDLAFYAPPRLVTHIDEVAVEALTGFYRGLLPDDGRILDLMSSWVSHLPADRRYREVVGATREIDGFKFAYKICRECGYALKFYFPATAGTSEAVQNYRQWKRYMAQ